MKILLSIIITISSIVANDFFAIIQPINTYNVKSSTSGLVVFANEDLKAKSIKEEIIIKIDKKLDTLELRLTQNKLNTIRKIEKIEKSTLATFKKVSSKSKIDRDNQEVKVLNTTSAISDLSIKISTLKDKISKKTLIEKNMYILDVLVKRGDYVNPGSLLYTALDLSAGKLEVYLPIDKVSEYENKKIFVDGIETTLKINKIYKVADSKHISAYKAEIIVNKPNNFSKVVKVSFK